MPDFAKKLCFQLQASNIVQIALLVASRLLALVGLGLTISGSISPAWQVVDIREFRAEHQHGLWWDCVRSSQPMAPVGDYFAEAPLHCMYKFDDSAQRVVEQSMVEIDWDAAALESEHHRFLPWQKAVLFFVLFGQVLTVIAIISGACSLCWPIGAFISSVSLFISVLSSGVADGLFFFAAHRIDVRYVQGAVGVYEQHIGYAFWLHFAGSVCLLFALACAIAITCTFLKRKKASREPTYDDIRPIHRAASEPQRYGNVPANTQRTYLETSA